MGNHTTLVDAKTVETDMARMHNVMHPKKQEINIMKEEIIEELI